MERKSAEARHHSGPIGWRQSRKLGHSGNPSLLAPDGHLGLRLSLIQLHSATIIVMPLKLLVESKTIFSLYFCS